MTHPQAVELRMKAISLRKEGWTFAEIGQELGVNHSTVSRWHSQWVGGGAEALDYPMRPLKRAPQLNLGTIRSRIAREKNRATKRKLEMLLIFATAASHEEAEVLAGVSRQYLMRLRRDFLNPI